MSWEALGAMGEVLGAIGVIVTSAFLAFQIRQNSLTLKTITRQLELNQQLATAEALGQANTQQEAILAMAQDAELSALVYRGLRDYEEMSSEDRMRFALVMGPLIAGVATQAERQLQLGMHGNTIGESHLIFVMDFIDTPGVRAWWQRYGNRYPDRFREAVDRMLSEAQPGVA